MNIKFPLSKRMLRLGLVMAISCYVSKFLIAYFVSASIISGFLKIVAMISFFSLMMLAIFALVVIAPYENLLNLMPERSIRLTKLQDMNDSALQIHLKSNHDDYKFDLGILSFNDIEDIDQIRAKIVNMEKRHKNDQRNAEMIKNHWIYKMCDRVANI